jgi:hypothetical protein
MKTELKTLSIAEFVKSKGFVEINNTIKLNSNGYPFVTFINADNVAENVYFSKAASANVKQDEELNIEMLNNYRIANTTNADGEVRTKLVSVNSKRINLASLLG